MQALASACSHATAHPHRPRRVQQSASLDPIPTAHTLLQPQHHHSPWLSRAHPGQPCPHRGPVPAARSSVTAQARGRPKKTPPKDAGADAQEDDSASPSGWDAALAGIPAIQAGSDLVVEDDEEIYADDEIDLLGDDVEDDVDVLRAAAGDSEGLDEDEEIIEDYQDDDDLIDDEAEEGEVDISLLDENTIEGTQGVKTARVTAKKRSARTKAAEDEAANEAVMAQGPTIETVPYDQALAAVAGNRTAAVRETEIRVLTADEVRAQEAALVKAEGGGQAVAIPEDAQLTLDRAGFQAFIMTPLEFLVATTMDGKFNLADSYVYDSDNDVYFRPNVQGKLPKGAMQMQVIPWVERKSADSLKQKEGMNKMKKVYFIAVESQAPYRIRMDSVYCFEGATRTLTHHPVPVPDNCHDPVLRIRADGIYVEDSGRMPTPWEVAAAGLTKEETAEEKERRLQERIEELEAQAEEIDELDEAPDVSAADMM